MAATIPLKRWRLARQKWRLDIDDEQLTVCTPTLKKPWSIPLTAVAGVCDLSVQVPARDELVPMHPPWILNMQTKGNLNKLNLFITLNPAQALPALRFGYYLNSGTRRRDVAAGAIRVDGLTVAAVDPAAASTAVERSGARRFTSRRGAVVGTIGGVPMASLADSEIRRLARAARMRRLLMAVNVALLAVLFGARLAVPSSSWALWGWLALIGVWVLLPIRYLLLRSVRRQSRTPLDTRR